MTDPEREHFAHQVHDLERRLRRWQLISFVLAALLLVPVVGVGLLGVIVVPRMARAERARAMEMEMRAAEAEARAQAEKARHEAEKARQEADKPRGEQKPRD
jgi:mannose/fructose/N-acetylgalactosamine-specific phosphotransferase system component IIC